MVYVCMFSFAIVFQSIPPLLSIIKTEFDIGEAQSGLLMSFFALPGIIIGLPSGMISDRFGMKKTGLTSLILMIFGTIIVATSDTIFQAYVGRVVSGIGGLTLAIVLPQLVSRWFLGKELNLGMGLFNTAMPLGTIMSLNFFSIIGKVLGWKTPILITTTAGTFALVIFYFLFKKPPEKEESSKCPASTNITRLSLPIWLVSLSWMWFNAAFISFITFSSKFFIEKGFEYGFAGFLSSLVMFGSLFLSPLIGYSIQKFGKEEIFIGVGGIILGLLILVISTSLYVFPILILIGLAVALVPAPIFSLPSKIVNPRSFGLAFGIITTCLNIGVLIGPFLAGLARDLTGDYVFSFYVLSLFAFLQTATIWLFSWSMRRRQGEKAI